MEPISNKRNLSERILATSQLCNILNLAQCRKTRLKNKLNQMGLPLKLIKMMSKGGKKEIVRLSTSKKIQLKELKGTQKRSQNPTSRMTSILRRLFDRHWSLAIPMRLSEGTSTTESQLGFSETAP